MARLENVARPINSIGTFEDDLGSGMSVQELKNVLSDLDLNDGEALKQVAGCCSPCCAGNDIDITIDIPSLVKSKPPSTGLENRVIKLRFTMPEA